jgi:predicted membrane protein
MEDSPSFRLTPQLLLGFFIILIGILFTLDNLDVLEAGEYLRHVLPAGIIAVGLTMLVQSKTPSGRAAGIVFSLVGILWLLGNLHLIRFSIWDYWPLILVAIGASMVWQAFARDSRKTVAGKGGVPNNLDSTVSAIAVLGGVVRKCNSKDFQGGELTAIMGGCEIDLREADIQSEEAVINTFAWWGGIEIKVPEDWTVISNGFPLMGGFADTTRPAQEGPKKRLVIKGFAIMGGVEIKN